MFYCYGRIFNKNSDRNRNKTIKSTSNNGIKKLRLTRLTKICHA